jgi:hypothetical protein
MRRVEDFKTPTAFLVWTSPFGQVALPFPAAPGRRKLRWFHLAMRIQPVAQAAKSWPETTSTEREEGARLADTIEHIHCRLWHGQVRRSLDLIGETSITRQHAAAMSRYRLRPRRVRCNGCCTVGWAHPTDALVTERGESDAQGPDLGRQLNLHPGPWRRRAMGPTSVSQSGVITPRCWTVSRPLSRS